MIDEGRWERAVEFLRDTAARYGKLRGHQVYCEANLRRVRSLELLIAEGSLGEREAKAYASEMYKQAMEAYENATAETETLRAQREAAVYTIETCRSQNSARKQGVSL